MVRDKWLTQCLFESSEEVQKFATKWLWKYNYDRPNMALDDFTSKRRQVRAIQSLPMRTEKNWDAYPIYLSRKRVSLIDVALILLDRIW
jgi:putative transposase